MTIERRTSSIEASFNMENMSFDTECINRVKGILSGKVLVQDALAELNKKYGIAGGKREGSGV